MRCSWKSLSRGAQWILDGWKEDRKITGCLNGWMNGRKEGRRHAGGREGRPITHSARGHPHTHKHACPHRWLSDSEQWTDAFDRQDPGERPHQPSGQGKLCTEDSQQWELGSQRLAGKTEKQVGTWIQNSGREEIRNTSYSGGKRSPGCHGDESQRGNRQPLPPRGQL